MHTINLPIYAPVWNVMAAQDWNLKFTHDLSAVMSAPFRIAAVPVLCSETFEFSYNPEAELLPWADFDLVILTDIEFRCTSEIDAWASKVGIQRYILAVGGEYTNKLVDSATTVWRPWWAYNLMQLNLCRPTYRPSKPYQFDVLLGARRPHRDYVMLGMQTSGLIDSSIVTYREVFNGGYVDHYSQQVAEQFPGTNLEFPYVSPNLDPGWEVQSEINNSVSPFVPYSIYDQTDYTVICETLGTHTEFFMSEKTAKAFMAQRVFVMFANYQFLKHLHKHGFKTFESVIDESYDNVLDPVDRYTRAWQQVLWLAKQDPTEIYGTLLPVLQHNQTRLYQLQQETKQHMLKILQQHVPGQYWN